MLGSTAAAVTVEAEASFKETAAGDGLFVHCGPLKNMMLEAKACLLSLICPHFCPQPYARKMTSVSVPCRSAHPLPNRLDIRHQQCELFSGVNAEFAVYPGSMSLNRTFRKRKLICDLLIGLAVKENIPVRRVRAPKEVSAFHARLLRRRHPHGAENHNEQLQR